MAVIRIVRRQKTYNINQRGRRGAKGDPGEGIPAGGDANQVLSKKSNADYDYEWQTPDNALDEISEAEIAEGTSDVKRAITGRRTRSIVAKAVEEMSGQYVESVIAGDNVSVDDADPSNPVISANNDITDKISQGTNVIITGGGTKDNPYIINSSTGSMSSFILEDSQHTPILVSGDSILTLMGSDGVTTEITDTEEVTVKLDEATKTKVDSAISSSEKGKANGVATLDAGGKVPLNQLNLDGMTLQGVWDASTNSPELSDANPSTNGFYYIVSVGGTIDIGSGEFTANPNDWIVWVDAYSRWALIPSSGDGIKQINGKSSSIVELSTDDVPQGDNNKYHVKSDWAATSGDSEILNKPSLPERVVSEGDVSTPGSFIELNLNEVIFRFTHLNVELVQCSIRSATTPVNIDMYRASIIGGGATETNRFDNLLLPTTPIVYDDAFTITLEQNTARIRIIQTGAVWEVKTFISGNGARATAVATRMN